jgi:hypothetical protein
MTATTYPTGARVRVTTRDHGHLAASRVKSFTGTVESVSAELTSSRGTAYRIVSVRLEPNLRSVRHFATITSSIEVLA